MKQTMNNKHQQLWILLLLAIMIVAGALWPAQPADASTLVDMKLKAPLQQVDTDGDGQTEPFSAAVEGYADGTANGRVAIGYVQIIVLKQWTATCENGVETAVLEGTLYQMNNGTQQEIGDVTIQASPANGGSGGGGADLGLDFDIINNAVQLQNFQAQGTLWHANPTCAS